MAKRLVELEVFEKRLVPVALPKVTNPRFAFVEKRFVEEAVPEKKLVEVAFVVVPLVEMKSVKPRRVVSLGRVVVAVNAASNLF